MIYTTGTIAINGNTVTGTGTDYSAPLSLIRVGCTLIAVSDPIQIFTITEIKSGTELSVTPAANPAIPAGTKFSILLSDSISVDGLAQDVAETLRYYQGKETEIAEAIEFFHEFDFNALTTLAYQVHTDSAQVSEDKAIVQQYKTDSESAKSAAEAAKDQAVLAQTAAESANTNAQAASTAAQGFSDQAKEWAQSVNADNLLTKSGNLAGLADLPTSRSNVGLGDADNVTHQSLRLKQNGTNYGGALESHRNDADGALLTKSMLVNELRDGKSITTIATENRGSSKAAYLAYDEDGILSGPREVRASSAVRVIGNASPKICLTNAAIDSTSMSNNVSLELNDDGIVRLYRRANDGTGHFQRLEFPQIEGVEGAETSLALKGGLLWNGNDVLLGDFDDIAQGWSYVAGNPANSPVASVTYGSCFSYCSQGLKEGNLPGSYNTKDVWWRQIYYTTENVTYSRVNTNKGEWRPWLEYTTSSVSDERLKDVLGSLNVEGALDNINRMDFKLFRFKKERDPNKAPTVRRGVISQQLRGIDKEYTKLIGGYYHLDRTPMLLDGLAAIKALRARDEANKARIAKLEGELEELKAAVAALNKS